MSLPPLSGRRLSRPALLLVLLGLLAAIMAAGLAYSMRATAAAPPTTGASLIYRGSLVHNWNGPISGACDFRFQLFDSDLNGRALGPAVTVTGVAVQQGTVAIPLNEGMLAAPPGAQTWLAVGLRCPNDGSDFAALAPRLRHHASQSGWDEPQHTATLLCTLSSGTSSASTAPPSLEGGDYTLRGGFWALPGAA